MEIHKHDSKNHRQYLNIIGTQIASGGPSVAATGGPLEICPLVATAHGFLNFYEIIDNIISKPQTNYIILKCTINYNYLRHTIYSNMILLFKKHENLWCLNNFYI